jgi:hypothetical protein
VRPAYHGMATQDGSQTARPSSKYRRSKAGSASGQPNSARAATRQHDPQLPINPPSHPVPITPQNAVKMYQGQLSNYELSEVLDYPQIYYVGTAGQKVRNTSVNKVRARARCACRFAVAPEASRMADHARLARIRARRVTREITYARARARANTRHHNL